MEMARSGQGPRRVLGRPHADCRTRGKRRKEGGKRREEGGKGRYSCGWWVVVVVSSRGPNGRAHTITHTHTTQTVAQPTQQ